MGVCYEVIVEMKGSEGSWVAIAHFDCGKAYEFARCFPHQGWPENEDGRFPFIEDEGDLPAGGTLDEVAAAYKKALTEPYARDFSVVSAILAAGACLHAEGEEVRLLIWGE
jgi:hypothetical protein